MIDRETDVKVDISFNQIGGVKSVKLIKVRGLREPTFGPSI